MPLLNRRPASEPEAFVAVARSEEVTPGRMTTVKLAGRKIILIRDEGRIFAVDSLCPHAAADLTQGTLRHWQLCCHEHDYCFDIRSGRIVWPEDEVYRLRRYEVIEEAGEIRVRLSPPP